MISRIVRNRPWYVKHMGSFTYHQFLRTSLNQSPATGFHFNSFGRYLVANAHQNPRAALMALGLSTVKVAICYTAGSIFYNHLQVRLFPELDDTKVEKEKRSQ